MNTKTLAKHYGCLTPEQRFRLLVAAGARGDEAERTRLISAGGRISISVQDHAPHAHAFHELSLLTFIELLEAAADYLDAFSWADDAVITDEDGPEDVPEEEDAEDAEAGPAGCAGDAEAEREARAVADGLLGLALAKGFLLKTKADGWKVFCERMSIPPFATWEALPGFERVRRALALAEKAAFVSEGVLRWLNDTRPAGEPGPAAVPLTVEGMANTTAEMFRQRVEWWGG